MSVGVEKLYTNERKLREMAGAPNQGNFWERVINVIKTAGAVFVVFASLIAATLYIGTNIERHNNEIKVLKDDAKEVKDSYKEIDKKIDELTDLVKSDHEIFLEIASIDASEAPYKVQMKDKYQVRTEEVKNEIRLADPAWENGNIIGTDANGDTIYNPEDLYNKPIITAYLDGKNEVYFYGRFNENNHWNGRCILNVYEENKLISIFEGIYDDGKIYSYKTVAVKEDDENEGEYIWLINDRVNQDEYNSGETWKYTKHEDYIKGFTLEDVKEKQITTVDKFISSRNEKLLSYYKGNTSNGLYNDSTEKAYLIKYKNDGNLDLLYVGKMKNGYPNDNTGNAWSVAWGYANDGYYYYNGIFTNGNHGKAPRNWKPMTQEEINEKINPDDFDYPLTGLIEE